MEVWPSVVSWQELATKTTAVLWVKDSHFLAVDTRKRDDSGGLLWVSETDAPGQWWFRRQLEEIWKGEVLVLNLPERARELHGTNPTIRWEKCLEDAGWIQSKEGLECVFPFCNVSTVDLTVDVRKVGCGCAKAYLTRKILKPGESAKLIVKINTKGRRGYYRTQVLIQTNGREHSYNTIYVSYGVRHDRLASADTLYFGECPKGQRIVRHLYFYDAGRTRLSVRNIRVELCDENGKRVDATHIKSFVEVSRIARESAAPQVHQRLPLLVGDFAVGFGLTVAEDCYTGPFHGRVVVATNQAGESSEITVDLRGEVISDFAASPRALLLTTDSNDKVASSITISRESRKAFNITDITLRKLGKLGTVTNGMKISVNVL